MPIVTLTFTPSADETISGIPNTVEIETNTAATIYYTIDGSLPTLLSEVYTEPVVLPTNENSIVLSAIAYFLDGYGNMVPSSVLSKPYMTDQSDLDRTRHLFFEGVVYSYPGGADIPFYYDENGDVSVTIDIPADQLEFIASDRDIDGDYIGTENEVEPVPPNETATLVDNDTPLFSTPNADTFSPEALYIEIDGRGGAPDQVVKLINGPYMSFRDMRASYGGIEFYNIQGANYISGDAVKHHYDRDKGTLVCYYHDSNTNRWVKSIQDLPDATDTTPSSVVSNPLVFKWFLYGRHQSV